MTLTHDTARRTSQRDKCRVQLTVQVRHSLSNTSTLYAEACTLFTAAKDQCLDHPWRSQAPSSASRRSEAATQMRPLQEPRENDVLDRPPHSRPRPRRVTYYWLASGTGRRRRRRRHSVRIPDVRISDFIFLASDSRCHWQSESCPTQPHHFDCRRHRLACSPIRAANPWPAGPSPSGP